MPSVEYSDAIKKALEDRPQVRFENFIAPTQQDLSIGVNIFAGPG